MVEFAQHVDALVRILRFELAFPLFVLLWAARLALRETKNAVLQSPFVIAFSLGPVLWSAAHFADYPPFLQTYPFHILLAVTFVLYVAVLVHRRPAWIAPLRLAVVAIHLVQLTWVALLAGAS